MAVRADFATRGFAICSLIARRVAAFASLSFLEFLLNMNDDGTFANQGMVNAVHTGWNTCRYGCRRQNCIGRTLGLSQGSIQRGSISSTPCELGPFPTQAFEALAVLDV